MYGVAKLEAFVSGVKLGVQIIVETYIDSSQNFKEMLKRATKNTSDECTTSFLS